MVERYLAIKLEKCAKCPAGQIVKYKLNNKKKSSTTNQPLLSSSRFDIRRRRYYFLGVSRS